MIKLQLVIYMLLAAAELFLMNFIGLLKVNFKISGLLPFAHIKINCFAIDVAFGVQLWLELVVVIVGVGAPREIHLSVFS